MHLGFVKCKYVDKDEIEMIELKNDIQQFNTILIW